ncbi:hypothetical protein [Chitinophaga varians]|uniref:hypothetical protein n=1 Tax=Chitinophaga varians TaxID=2202339 RepID=UPI00165ED926|nr:hypothetical protein [Chitinophaga varians]MBC9913179.1 hypothetical protein [Chitinophaga varians]
MVNASELRIGNLLYYKNEVIRVSMFSPNNVYFQNQKQVGVIFVNPIPLTEEWLLNLGFSKGQRYEYRIDLFKIFGDELIIDMEYYGDYRLQPGNTSIEHQTVGGSCRHVHQLQNIYFALTGQELTLNTGLHENS